MEVVCSKNLVLNKIKDANRLMFANTKVYIISKQAYYTVMV